jgi:arylsulfatase
VLVRAWGCLAAVAVAAGGCGGAPAPRLCLLVTVDTLRADHLGAYGSPLGLTPHLDALAAQSLVFEAAYAPVPLTLPSIATLLTGRWPEELGIRSNESALPAGVSTLAGDLRESGWRTAAVVSNFVLREASGLAAGFERYDDELPRREAVRGWPERRARDASDAALGLLDACAGLRCFVWLHYQDPHGPYDPPPGGREAELPRAREAEDAARRLPVAKDHAGVGAIPAYQYLGGRRDVAYYRAGYRGEVAYVDREVGRLLEGVRARGLDATSVVVFAADHGESLGERDVWFAHGGELTDEQVRIPLFLRIPGRAPARRADVATLADLRATLLRLLPGRAPAGAGPGRDLLAPGAERAASPAYLTTPTASGARRFAVIDAGHKLIVSEEGGAEQVELYRLGREEVDLAGSDSERVRALRERLASLRAALRAVPDAARQELSAEDQATLRALGYSEETASE